MMNPSRPDGGSLLGERGNPSGLTWDLRPMATLLLPSVLGSNAEGGTSGGVEGGVTTPESCLPK